MLLRPSHCIDMYSLFFNNLTAFSVFFMHVVNAVLLLFFLSPVCRLLWARVPAPWCSPQASTHWPSPSPLLRGPSASPHNPPTPSTTWPTYPDSPSPPSSCCTGPQPLRALTPRLRVRVKGRPGRRPERKGRIGTKRWSRARLPNASVVRKSSTPYR